MTDDQTISDPPFKTGRKPPVPGRRSIPLADILSGVLPAIPAEANWLNIGGWQMLANDQYGDCVAVSRATLKRVVSRMAGREVYPGLDETLEFYRTQNPDFPRQDDGMVIQYALEEMQHRGEIVAFAQVDTRNLEEVKAAVAIFGGVWLGIDVTAANMAQFDRGQPWDYVATSRNLGGHSVIGGGYDSDQVAGDIAVETWADVTSFTDRYWNNAVEEAWVVVWPENLGTAQFQTGINLDALADAFQTITGRVLPLPETPPPAPPAPDVDPADVIDATFWDSTAVQEFVTTRHYGGNERAARALRTWAHDRGLT